MDEKFDIADPQGGTVPHGGARRMLDLLIDKFYKPYDPAREGFPFNMIGKPQKNATVFAWLDWQYEMRKAGKKMTYEMLAAECGCYAKGTFEQAAGNWKKERGYTQENTQESTQEN